MPAAEEAAVRRQWGGVRSPQDEVTRTIHKRGLLLRMASPQHEDDRLVFRVHLGNDAVGEAFPAALAVGCRAAHFHGKDAVEQQHALFRPMLEEAVAHPFNSK